MRKYPFVWLVVLVLCIGITPPVFAELEVPEDLAAIQDAADFVDFVSDEQPFVEIPFTVRRQGSDVAIDVRPVSGDLDTYLFLVDNTGTIISENDDRPHAEYGDFSSRIAYPQAEAGEYRIVVSRYGITAGRTEGYFRLLIDIEEPQTPLSDVVYRVRPGELQDAGFPVQEPKDPAKWTVLVYYGGDTNLEPNILSDFKEFELAGGSTNAVRVIAMMDRHPEFSEASGDWRSTRLFEVNAAQNPTPDDLDDLQLDTRELADFGNLDTSNGEVFAQFLTWSIRHYPAENYVVALGGHGAGWRGVVTDDSVATEMGFDEEEVILSLPELSKAFDLALTEASVDKFALLINDACSMSSVEYYGVVANYFNFSVASPEIVVNPALDMTLFLDLLRANPSTVDLKDVGTQLIDTYKTQVIDARGAADSVYLNHAVTDLTRFDAVNQAVEHFATLVNEQPVVRPLALANARSNAYTYTHFMGGETKIDIGNLMTRIIDTTNDEELVDAASEVLRTLNRAVVHGAGGERVERVTSYYNVYFPNNSAAFDSRYFDETPIKEWGRMLRRYYNSFNPTPWSDIGDQIPFHAPISPKIRITQLHPADTPASILNPPVLGIEVEGRNISHADVTIDQVQPDGTAIRLSNERFLTDVVVDGEIQRLNQWEPGITQRNIEWDVALPVVTDGTQSHNERLVITEDVAFLEGRYQEAGGETWHDVGVTFDVNEGSVQRVVNRSGVTGALAVVEIQPGATFQAYRAVVAPDGDVDLLPGNTYTWGENGLSWSWEVAPSGEYRLGMLVTSFGGSTGHTSASLIIDNAGQSVDFRGETITNLGFTLTRPAEWDRLGEGRLELFTQNETRTAAKRVYLVIAQPDSPLEEVATSGAEFHALTINGDYEELTVDGLPVLGFDYTVMHDEQPYDGRGFAAIISNRFPVIFGAEVLQNAEESLDTYHQTLVNETIFFDALALPNTAQWIAGVPLDERRIAAPIAWLDFQEEGEQWLQLFRSVTDEATGEASADPYTFIATGVFELQSQVRGDRSTLNNIITGTATGNADQLVITDINTYFGESHTWDATIYEGVRDGVEIVGRVYVTPKNGRAYAVWVETRRDNDVRSLFENVFEPFVDSIIISEVEETA